MATEESRVEWESRRVGLWCVAVWNRVTETVHKDSDMSRATEGWITWMDDLMDDG